MTTKVITIILICLPLMGCKKKSPKTSPVPSDSSTVGVVTGENTNPTTTNQPVLTGDEEAERERTNVTLENLLNRDNTSPNVVRTRDALREKVLFEYDSEALTEEAQEILRRKAAILKGLPRVGLRIEGHADASGAEEYNFALGQRRAETVRAFLSNYGLQDAQLKTLSLGETRPANPGMDEDSMVENRRAEFKIISAQ